jgi:sporulation protein YlmC with PRC-barrel domain
MTEIHIELLLGTQVVDSEGRSVGRLEEVLAEPQGEELVVTEYLLGSYAIIERLSAWTIGRALLDLFGVGTREGYRVPWDKLDLSDPVRPRLTCSLDELKTITAR